MQTNPNKNAKSFPIVRKNERTLPKHYDGFIYTWDIDGTYLDTNTTDIKSLIKIPFEVAIEKKTIQGADTLLRALRKGPYPDEDKLNPLYFITASPHQLHKVITKKMFLDGVQYDGITYKDFLGVISNFHFDEFKQQITYKLFALLENRLHFPIMSNEILFGDNLEQDAEIYKLYDKIMDKNYDLAFIERQLKYMKLKEEYITKILHKVESITKPKDSPVKKIYIHLTRNEDLAYYKKYSNKHIPVSNFFQASASLFEEKHIPISAVKEVFLSIISNKKNDTSNYNDIINGLKLLTKNNYIKKETEEEITDFLSSH